MTIEEIRACIIADKYVGNLDQESKLKKLGEEVAEFIIAVMKSDNVNMKEEAGDVCFLILHILSKEIPQDEINIDRFILEASDKMFGRFGNK